MRPEPEAMYIAMYTKAGWNAIPLAHRPVAIAVLRTAMGFAGANRWQEAPEALVAQ